MNKTIRWSLALLVLPAFLVLSSCGKQEASSPPEKNEASAEEPPPLDAYRKQVSHIDTLLQAEKQVRNYRIGVFLQEQRKRFSPDGSPLEPSSGDVYLGVTLREKRTKRYLPGSTVTVSLGDQTWTLDETWGDFHHYGANVPVPFDKESDLVVKVSPPAYGRHAEMKGTYLEKAQASFPIKPVENKAIPVVSGPGPAPVPEDVETGSSIRLAVEESTSIKTAGPYRIGFIVEGAEPFWTWADGELSMHPGKDSNPYHFEIVLLDRKTYEPIPHANVSLTFSGDEVKTVDLFPLLAEFYHYGNNAAAPAGSTFTVTASVRAPALHTFEKGLHERGRHV